MARNKYPEDTVKKILDVTSKLFLENGYENTSIQNIVNHLGMSKGAIYHHFKSKEELLERITNEYFSNMDWFVSIIHNKELNGLEKLREIFYYSLGNDEKSTLDKLTRPIMSDAKIIVELYHNNLQEIAPLIEKIILEGNRDGSLDVAFPRETAELMLICINLWMSPFLNPEDEEAYIRKAYYLKFLLEKSGMPVINEKIIDLSRQYYKKVTKGCDNI